MRGAGELEPPDRDRERAAEPPRHDDAVERQRIEDAASAGRAARRRIGAAGTRLAKLDERQRARRAQRRVGERGAGSTLRAEQPGQHDGAIDRAREWLLRWDVIDRCYVYEPGFIDDRA